MNCCYEEYRKRSLQTLNASVCPRTGREICGTMRFKTAGATNALTLGFKKCASPEASREGLRLRVIT